MLKVVNYHLPVTVTVKVLVTVSESRSVHVTATVRMLADATDSKSKLAAELLATSSRPLSPDVVKYW